MSASKQPNLIEVKLRDLNQLFNSMDPSPFHEKDLDHDAEEFIVSWAMEYPLDEPISLAVHLEQAPTHAEPKRLVADAVHHFFEYQAQLKRRELRDLIARGRKSLVIGLVCLAISLAAGQMILRFQTRGIGTLIQESLLIGGWVAMWRPMQIFLHDWWPVLHRRRLYEKLSIMQVEIRGPGERAASAVVESTTGQYHPPLVKG